VVTLLEGGTPLVPAPVLSARTGCDVWLKVEGSNPTGSFKDRGMTVAVSRALEEGARAVLCASTGNTSASAAAYAARAAIRCAVVIPEGRVALGKLAQALVHGASVLAVDGSFDDCLVLVRELAERYPVALVNSVNPLRIQGQKTVAFEIVEALGDAPDVHCIPVGNAGNITATWLGYTEAGERRPAMLGFQAAGAAPLVTGAPVERPATIASAIRLGRGGPPGGGLLGRAAGRGHRPPDPRRLPPVGPRGGRLRRDGLGRLGGRPPRRQPPPWPSGRLHRHRQRPQGPRLGTRRRPTPHPHPPRPRRRRRPTRAGLAAGPLTALPLPPAPELIA
jgi:Pyridoxal-phosphate dependent enzyme